MILSKKCLLSILIVVISAGNIISQLNLPKIFSSNMMMQCETIVPIWGQSSPNSEILVKLNTNTFAGTSNSEGKWKLEIPAQKAGAIFTIKVLSNQEQITLSNVIFGDIWLCGGQSNMEWYVESSDNAQEEINSANYPDIRLFDVPRKIETLPAYDLVGGEWNLCSPATIPQFSAVGYYFGKRLAEKLERPIGLIGNNYGGTIAEAWMSEEGLSTIPFFDKAISDLNDSDIEEVKRSGDDAFNIWLTKFKSEDAGIKNAVYKWATEDDFSDWKDMQLPTAWESAHDTSLHEKDGVVWFTKKFEIENISDGILSLGPIDDSDMTWINGVNVGETYNQFNKDRKYQLNGSVLVVGSNVITVRVEDYVGGGGIYGSKEQLFLQVGTKKIDLSGKWKYKKGMITNEPMPSNSFSPNNFPTCLYNGMIHPLIEFPIKGVIWYQGESNSYRAYEYKSLFPLLIQDWRSSWKQPEMPFIFVQLANFKAVDLEPTKSEWAELREAQEKALSLPNTAMIATIDIGEGNNIHPTNKQEVGLRLANAAMTEVYNRPEPYKGPTYKTIATVNATIEVTFDNVGDGIRVDDKFGYLYGFTIAGIDGEYVWAKAEIIGKNKVRVWSNSVSKPISIRYAWQDNPVPANLKNSYDLPAFPFRTDNYELSTFSIKRF